MKKENKENKSLRSENCVDKKEDYSNTTIVNKSEDYNNILDADKKEEYNGKCCVNEKKIIIYLIVLALVLIFYSLFFIHYINFRGTIKDTQSVEINYPQNNDGNNIIDFDNSQDNSITNNGQINNGQLNNVVNGNMSNNIGNGQVNNTEENIVNNKDRFKIMQGTENWKDLKTLDIFNNYYFNDHSIIAPGVSGEYSFTVENYRETNMKYNLNFIEQNIYNINMVYKLKLNGSYIAGDEQRYVKYQELNKEDLVINTNTSDVLTIEWKWQDNNNDTQIGKTEGSNYKMSIKVDAFDLEN